jgi:hypothetical protein
MLKEKLTLGSFVRASSSRGVKEAAKPEKLWEYLWDAPALTPEIADSTAES